MHLWLHYVDGGSVAFCEIDVDKFVFFIELATIYVCIYAAGWLLIDLFWH